jgi:hypothetical protein
VESGAVQRGKGGAHRIDVARAERLVLCRCHLPAKRVRTVKKRSGETPETWAG